MGGLGLAGTANAASQHGKPRPGNNATSAGRPRPTAPSKNQIHVAANSSQPFGKSGGINLLSNATPPANASSAKRKNHSWLSDEANKAGDYISDKGKDVGAGAQGAYNTIMGNQSGATNPAQVIKGGVTGGVTWNEVASTITNPGKTISTTVEPGITRVGSMVPNVTSGAIPKLPGLGPAVNPIIKGLGPVASSITSNTGSTFSGVGPGFTPFGSGLGTAAGSIAPGISPMLPGLGAAAAPILGGIQPGPSFLPLGIPGATTPSVALNTGGGVSSTVSSVPIYVPGNYLPNNREPWLDDDYSGGAGAPSGGDQFGGGDQSGGSGNCVPVDPVTWWVLQELDPKYFGQPGSSESSGPASPALPPAELAGAY
jgi:hypothetical protein